MHIDFRLAQTRLSMFFENTYASTCPRFRLVQAVVVSQIPRGMARLHFLPGLEQNKSNPIITLWQQLLCLGPLLCTARIVRFILQMEATQYDVFGEIRACHFVVGVLQRGEIFRIGVPYASE